MMSAQRSLKAVSPVAMVHSQVPTWVPSMIPARRLFSRRRDSSASFFAVISRTMETMPPFSSNIWRSITDRRNVLVVLERDDVLGWKSVRNVLGVHLLVVDQLNTYDVLCSDDVVFTTAALDTFLGAKPAVSTTKEAAQ